MKKCLIVAVFAALCSCTAPNGYVITGEVAEGVEKVYLIDREAGLIDSAAVEQGRFRMEGTIEVPSVADLCDSRQLATSQLRLYLVLEAGTIRIVPAADGGYVAVGTPANDAWTAVTVRRRTLMDEYRSEETSDQRREEIQQEFSDLVLETIKTNSDNLYGLLLLNDLLYDDPVEELQNLIDGFSPAMQQHPLMAEIKESVAKKLLTEVGQPCIDFGQPTADGQVITLRSVVENPANKLVLLDFWASWCGPCMGEVPYLVQTYREFHDKGFEIFGVSLDNNRERWLDAIESKAMNWIHVSDLLGWQNAAAADYGVRSIPANFLLDAEGRIVATNLRGEQLYAKIAELLN